MDIQNLLTQLQQTDYLLLEIMKPIIIFYISQFAIKKAKKAYSLHRDYKPKDISMVVMPPELINNHVNFDADKIAATQFKDSISKFAEVMIKNFSPKDLVAFYNNINNLKVSAKKSINEMGVYRGDLNRIIINPNNASNNTTFHELFHMSSSIYKDHVIYYGFSQCQTKPNIIKIGIGLNEGYTELLTKRYFGDDNGKARNPYIYQTVISSLIEEIVGKEKMESLYLNANLRGLIDEMKQYISEDEIMKFISSMDFITSYMYDKKIGSSKNDMINNSLKAISRFLIICYSKKIIQDPDTYEDKMVKFIAKLSINPTINGHQYEAITNEVVSSALGELSELKTNSL